MDGTQPTQTPGYASVLPPGHPSSATPPQPSFGEGFGSVSPAPGFENARFAPLSALPPEKRLPPRRGTPGPPVAATQSTQIAPRELPGIVHPNPARQISRIKQIGFNCPSCLAILIIKQPEHYDGQAAPCPNCNVVILPPRIAPASPFTLLGGPNSSAPYPPPTVVPTMLPPMPRQVPMGLPAPVEPNKPGLPGARRLAQAAMF
jgi:hypothetical protein